MSGVEEAWGRDNHLTKPLAFSHNMGQVFPPTLAKAHPEFFPLADGKRLEPPKGSNFWNPDLGRPDVATYATAAAREYFRAHPDEPSFALGVNDGLVFGESPETRALVAPPKWFRERPDYSPLVFTFMNRAAEDLARTHPEKYLGALAYYWAENVPPFPLHPQVVPFLTADRAQGYDTSFWREELALQEAWGKLAGAAVAAPSLVTGQSSLGSDTKDKGQMTNDSKPPPRRLGIYDYLYGGGYLIPRIFPHLLAEHLRHARRAGFTDYYAEVYPNWGLDGPMPWLTAQLLQDPELSEDALLDEYYRSYFQEAAEPMRRFFERCEKLWLNQPGPAYWLKHYRNESQAVIFPPEACSELRGLIDLAAKSAKGAKNPKIEKRVELVSVAFGVTERLVAFHAARVRLVRLVLVPPPQLSVTGYSVLGSNQSPTSNTQSPIPNNSSLEIIAALREYVERRRDFVRHTSAVLRDHPLAIAKFKWTDYLRNDPVAAALVAVHRSRSLVNGHSLLGTETDVDAAVRALGWPEADAIWKALAAAKPPQSVVTGPLSLGSDTKNQGQMTNDARPREIEILRNAGFLGPIRPARKIADLDYGVALPADWLSKVEPAQYARVQLLEAPAAQLLGIEIRESGSSPSPQSQIPNASAERVPNNQYPITSNPAAARLLRFTGSKDAAVSQWNAVRGVGLHRASVAVRGKVSPGTMVALEFGWLDKQEQHIGIKTLRLPDGDWPEWVTLQQAGIPPARAVWVGMGIRILHQVPGDWIEARNPSLKR